MNHHFTLVCEAALIGNIPITGLSTRNNSAICGAILFSHLSVRELSVIFTSNSHSRHVADSMTNVAICYITLVRFIAAIE